MAIVLRATNENGVVADLDVRQDVDLRLDISAIENTDIGGIYGVSTQTFALPDTPINNQFFGNLFNLGSTPGVALQNSIPCQLLQDGIEIMNGKMYIVDITTNQRGLTFYNVNLVNETVDFRFQLENMDNPLLSSLDWEEYTHKYTYNSITSSWVDGPLEDSSPSYPLGSIIYPHVNYGQTEGSTDPEYALGGQPGKIDNDSSPLSPTDFKPAIKAKAIVDKIFDTLNYKYTSSFFDSPEFENLYVLSTSNEAKGATGELNTGSMGAYTSVDVDITTSFPAQVLYQTEVYDTGNNYNTGTSTYTAGANGFYQFNTQITFTIQNPQPLAERSCVLSFKKNGTIVKSFFSNHLPTSGVIQLPYNDNLLVGDLITVEVEYASDAGIEVFRVEAGQFNSYLNAVSPASIIGAEIFYGNQLPPELTALEFLQGLIEKFNLVIEPLQDQRNVLLIEPYENWLDVGTQLDWTDKVDRSVNFKIVHPISEQPASIKFSDLEDIDILTKYHKENFGKIFGEYEYRTSSNLAIGEKTIGKVFGPCPVKQIAGSSQFVTPHMCKKDAEQPDRPFKFLPRLVQRIGLQTVGTEAQGVVQSTGVTNVGNYWFMDDATPRLHNQYFAVGALSAVNNDFNTDTTLHFNATNTYAYTGQNVNGQVKADAFRTYWATYLNSELYDLDARKVTLNVYLKPTEYFNFQLNNKIFIDGAYYRINKISGGNLSKSESVEVELIKILNRRLKFPRVRLVGGDIVTIDYNTGLSPAGGVIVINDATGVPVGGRQIAGFLLDNAYQFQAADGAGSTGQGNWNYSRGATNVSTQKIVGTGLVDDRATNNITTGTDNVINPSANTLVVGKQNTIGQTSNNVSMLGVGHATDISEVSNAGFYGGSGNQIISGSDRVEIVGGAFNTISNSALSTIVGGINNLISDTNNVGGSRNVIIGGFQTNVSGSTSTIVINSTQEPYVGGSSHTVIGDVDAADLGNLYRNNSVLLDTNYENGAKFFTSKLDVMASAGSLQDLQSPAFNKAYIIFVGWTGGNGTATIQLPAIVGTSNQKQNGSRQFRIKLNGSFSTGGQNVRIEPPASELASGVRIDGASFKQYSNAYKGLTLQEHNQQWYILQETP